MKKDNDKKRKINLSFDNLAIPEVHLHTRTMQMQIQITKTL